MEIIPIPAFFDNYIWLLRPPSSSPDSNKVWVVDPGDAAPVASYLKEQGLELAGILITHHHGDHVGGVSRLCEEDSIPVYGPNNEQIPHVTHKLNEGDQINIDSLTFNIIDVPGHTAGHIAYYCEHNDAGTPILFCGDTLFAAGCGRLFEGTPEQMFESLNKLASLPSDTAVYCTHEYTESNLKFAEAVEPGNTDIQERIRTTQETRSQSKPSLPSSILKELATNPFLRCNEPSVVASATQHAGKSLDAGVETFAAIRGWKDNF